MSRTSIDATIQNPELIARRRAAICQSAVKVAKQKGGFHCTTTREIAAAAGINIATMYQYIQRKEDILFLICQTNVEEMKVELDAAALDPIVELELRFRKLIEVSDRRRVEINLMYQESATLEKRYLDAFKALDEQAVDLFEQPLLRAKESGLITCEQTRLFARHLLETGYAWAHKHWSFKKFTSREEYANRHWDWMKGAMGLRNGN